MGREGASGSLFRSALSTKTDDSPNVDFGQKTRLGAWLSLCNRSGLIRNGGPILGKNNQEDAMKSLKTRLAVLSLSTICLLTSAYAQITPSADAYTNTATPTTNFGAATLLDVAGTTQKTYIQFNLSSIPAGAIVSQATLKLYVNAVLTAGSFNVYAVNGAWSEGAITSSLAPLSEM
jgi:hypothetical protein